MTLRYPLIQFQLYEKTSLVIDNAGIYVEGLNKTLIANLDISPTQRQGMATRYLVGGISLGTSF